MEVQSLDVSLGGSDVINTKVIIKKRKDCLSKKVNISVEMYLLK